MARLLIEGFENGGLTNAAVAVGSVATGVSGMVGTYCFDCTGAITGYVEFDTDTNRTRVYASWYQRFNHAYGGMFGVFNETTRVVRARKYSNGIRATVGNSTSIIDTGDIGLTTGVTYQVEMFILLDSISGKVAIKVDGTEVANYIGDTTVGSTIFNKLRFGYQSENFWWGYSWIDNIVVDDSDWIGLDSKVMPLSPNGAGSSTLWTPSAGSNHECVDEIPASGSDYIYTNATGDLDLYTVPGISGASEVKCIQVEGVAVTEDSPTPTSVQAAIRTGGTTYKSGSLTVPATAAGVSNIWNQNPGTSGDWTPEEVNDGLEIGFESAS